VSAVGEEPLRAELSAFVDVCAGRRENPVTAADGVHALEVVEAAALSARVRREVALVPKGGLEPPHPCGHMALNRGPVMSRAALQPRVDPRV
jgi:hypothetical protein